MWKTNKWVPEWVIRHAIAHLHPGPQPPCRCAGHTSRESERRAIHQGGRQVAGKLVPSATTLVLRSP